MKLVESRLLIVLLILSSSGLATAGQRAPEVSEIVKNASKHPQNVGGARGSGLVGANRSEKESSAAPISAPLDGPVGKSQGANGKSKLSPDERKALRQQIHDVEQELHRTNK
ncbi:hypothetical protein [Undibacterium sp. RuRC25W]|uniref:hypothetical protein n=1 Tax=Undibacterium sp. RuRC25W TaxID=3413047 RepID=UPI003BF440C3